MDFDDRGFVNFCEFIIGYEAVSEEERLVLTIAFIVSCLTQAAWWGMIAILIRNVALIIKEVVTYIGMYVLLQLAMKDPEIAKKMEQVMQVKQYSETMKESKLEDKADEPPPVDANTKEKGMEWVSLLIQALQKLNN